MQKLGEGLTIDRDIAASCLLLGRDEIRHSGDLRRNPVTLKASEVLAYRIGFCSAKSHLPAVLLRANGIPASVTSVLQTGILHGRFTCMT
ncbi:MAG: transglutaminase family protein [Methanoregula sp.]|nr:transglutaminase family protein [Methanoregula sp.]